MVLGGKCQGGNEGSVIETEMDSSGLGKKV